MDERVSSVEKLSLLFKLSHAFSAFIRLEELLPCVNAKTKEVLRQNQGNAAKSAKLLGISRQMPPKKIQAYGLRTS